jgi:glutaredoxin
MKPVLTLYTRHGCHLCDTAKETLLQLQHECDFEYEECDIDDNDDWTEKYGLMIPVVEVNGKEVQYGHVDKKFIYEALTKK